MSKFKANAAVLSALALAACGGENNSNSELPLVTDEEEAARIFTELSGSISEALVDGETLTARRVSTVGWKESYEGDGGYDFQDSAFTMKIDGSDLIVSIEIGDVSQSFRIVDADTYTGLDDKQFTLEIDELELFVDIFFDEPLGEYFDINDSTPINGAGVYFRPSFANYGVQSTSWFGTETTDAYVDSLISPEATYLGGAHVSIRRSDQGWSTFNANLSGDTEIVANFVESTVSGEVGNLSFQTCAGSSCLDPEAVAGAIVMESASIVGSTFEGTVTPNATLVAEDVELSSAKGSYGGTFYGADADVVAGTVKLSSDYDGSSYLGMGRWHGELNE